MSWEIVYGYEKIWTGRNHYQGLYVQYDPSKFCRKGKDNRARAKIPEEMIQKSIIFIFSPSDMMG